MPETIIVALITTLPPTLAALTAIYHTRKLRRPLDEVNSAVNNRKPGERKLVEMVEDLRDGVAYVAKELDRHRAWHTQVQDEDTDDLPL